MKKKTIKRGFRRTSRRQRQTGGFFPIGALSGPVVGRIASNLAGPLLKK